MSIFEWFWEKVTKPQDEKRIKTLRYPIISREINDIPYENSGEKHHLLDVYYSTNDDGILPTVIDIHGGGWYYGDKDLNKIYCLNLAERGFKVVNVSYRLTPFVSLKEQVQDVVKAINFAYDNAKTYGIDTNNLFLTGDSAGGHLASLIINLSKDEEMQKAFEVALKPTFKAVCYTCPALYVSKLATKPVVKSYFKPLLGKKAKENPIFPYVDYRPEFSQGVPSLFITCDGDFMKNQTLIGYEDALAHDVECELIYYKKEDQTNSLTHVYNVIQPDFQESKETNDKTIEFFKKYVK